MSLGSLRSAALEPYGRRNRTRPYVVASAPGRVELLGNHTDYNGGLVLAAAIDRHTLVVGHRLETADDFAFQSLSFANEIDFRPSELVAAKAHERESGWGRYVEGVVWALQEVHGPVRGGARGVIAGNVPLGAGLSSSASLQGALAAWLLGAGAFGSKQMPGNEIGLMELAKTLRRSENEYVGVGSGLLDQFAVLFGRDGHALKLDCRTLAHQRLPLGNSPPAIVVCDTKTSRRLADGMYNQRRSESDKVLAWFQSHPEAIDNGASAIGCLSELSVDALEAAWNHLDPVGRRRARHVLTENDRVRRGTEALERGDIALFGRLMSESHASSRDDFGNSSPALDQMVEAAERSPGYLGGKLSGAGWAGCVVCLVLPDQAEAFAEGVRERYRETMEIVPEIHNCRAAAGAVMEIVED